MAGSVIPLRETGPDRESASRFNEDDMRRIHEIGDRLVEEGRASGVRRFTGRTGKDVMVILDTAGVIEFGIEKSPDGYVRFNCDCDTVARSERLAPLLERYSEADRA